MRRAIMKLPAMLAATTLTACLGHDGDPLGPRSTPPAEVVGTYTMRAVDGYDLPVVWSQNGSATMELVGGTFELNADGSCSETTRWRPTDGANAPVTTAASTACIFTVNGEELRFSFASGMRHTTTIGDGTFSYLVPGGVLVTYQRDTSG